MFSTEYVVVSSWLWRSLNNVSLTLCLKLSMFFADFSSDVKSFHILGQRYERQFCPMLLLISQFLAPVSPRRDGPKFVGIMFSQNDHQLSQ